MTFLRIGEEARLSLFKDQRRAYVGASIAAVELWPRTSRPLGCA